MASTNRAKRLSGINTLAYLGIEPITAPLLIVKFNNEIPTTDDRVGNQIGALWISMNTAAGSPNARIFFLTRLDGSGPSGIATWTEVQTGGTGPGVDFVTTDDGNTAIPVFGNLNVFGGLTDRGGINALNMTTYNDPAGSDNVFIALQESIFLPDTTDINNGVIGLGGTADGNRFMHNFGAGGGVDDNTFVGLGSGNFTLTGTNSVGIGDRTLQSLTTGDNNTIVGSGAGSSINTGNRNVCIGGLAGFALSSGDDNIAIGDGALVSQTTGSQLIAIGTDALSSINNTSVRLTAVGYQALNLADAACDNVTAFGWHAGFNAVTVSSSVFIGENAGASASGIRNTFVGVECGSSGCSGTQNTGVGADALRALTSGLNNTAMGRRALFALTTGNNNVAIGQEAAASVSTGQGNVAIGTFALIASTVSDNIAIGRSALLNSSTGTPNVAIGTLALGAATTSSNTIAIGYSTGASISTGSESVYIGSNTAPLLTTASANVAIGFQAMLNTPGNSSSNVAIGWNCMALGTGHSSAVAMGFNAANAGSLNTSVVIGFRANETGVGTQTGGVIIGSRAGLSLNASQDVVAIGRNTLQTGTNLNGDVAIGRLALGSISTGTPNVAVGFQALEFIATGANNIALGTNAGVSLTLADSSNICIGNTGIVGDNNTTRIGTAGAGAGQQNKCFIGGIRGITTGVADAIAVLIDSAHQLGTVSSSARYKDNIQDMDEESSPVMELRPVTFTYKNDDQKRMQYGLIAEEVDKVMPRLVVYDEEGLPQSVRYNDLPQLLLNELKKLEKRVSHLERLCDTCKHIC